jgi:hypothetical protein
MEETVNLTKIQKMTMEEKLGLLSETDRAYIQGYLERAVQEYQRRSSGAAQDEPAKFDKGRNGG